MKLDLLAIGAHPDDVELSCAGTLMVHALRGLKVGILDLTAGELGTRGSAETRAAESRAALDIMGLALRDHAGLPDGFFRNERDHQIRVIEFLRYYRPEIVLANAIEDRHPDHGRGAGLVEDACFLSGLIKVETYWDGQPQEAWRPRQVLHYIQDRWIEPQLIIDITPVIDRKMDAIRAFRSQFLADPAEANQTYISSPEFFQGLIDRAHLLGRMIGVSCGEGFTSYRKIGLRDLMDLIW